MAPKKSKNSKKNKIKNSATGTASSTSSSSAFSFQVDNTRLPQTLPGGPYQTNPYQFDGPRNAFEAKTVAEGFYVRVDMPGVKKDLLEVNFENKKLSFSGKAPQGSIYEAAPRNYRGEITFNLESLEVSHFKVDINNGVLRVVLVGSGFPPNYYAASSHLNRNVPGTPQTCILNNEVLMIFDQFRMLDRPDNFSGMYPFQVDGEKGSYEMRGISDVYCFLRIDMPDVDYEGLSLRLVSDRKMVYGGTGVKASEYDESKRLYFGTFTMQCPCDCIIVEMDGGITDGVVRLLIKKERVKPTQRIHHTSWPTAGPR